MNNKREEISTVGRALLLAIIAVGCWFRLHDLGVMSFRADTILLWSLANRPVPLMDVLFKWFEVSGAAGQMPMPAFLMKAFLAIMPVEVTPFTVRLPFVLLGIAAMPMAYFAGRFMVNWRFGIIMTLFVALNPFHVHFSREAYFYSALFLGYFIYLRAIAGFLGYLWENKAPPRREYVILGLALFFSGYSQMSGLLLCAVGFIYITVELLRRQKKMGAFAVFGKVIGLHALVFFPFLFVPWGPREMIVQFLNTSQTEYNKQVVALSGENVVTGLISALSGFSWGTTYGGWALLIVSLALSLVALKKMFSKFGVFVLVFLVLQVLLFIMVRSALGALYESRYISGLFPFWLFLLACGWYWLATRPLPASISKLGPVWLWIPFVIPAAAWIYPSYLVTQQTGNPTPYYDIVRKTDSLLPFGSPVLIDRWFEPWNEMRSHPSTNVVFMFTVPNEPLQAFLQNNWRRTAEDFLTKNPDAAYLEIAKTYHDVPSVGPWKWPHSYFARREVIVNDAGLKLAKMGLAGRGSYTLTNTNRLIVELFYNTRDDVIAKLKENGTAVFPFYGQGWTYEKSGPMGIFRFQTQEFVDWRMMARAATLEVMNFTDVPQVISLRIAGLSPAGPKRVLAVNGKSFEFTGNRIQTWELGPLRLNPGLNVVTLEDVLKDRAQYPLLVASIDINMMETRDATATETIPPAGK